MGEFSGRERPRRYGFKRKNITLIDIRLFFLSNACYNQYMFKEAVYDRDNYKRKSN